ncbi:MAG: hypothetical protein JJU28_20440 [Cyclobacteriaceae bacterium]|nr:hypothetical protein [Cyclobacteriaceae bacterium]
MRLIITTFFIALATYLAGFFEPWWLFVPLVFAISFLPDGNSGKVTFIAGFIGVGALWLFLALYIDQKNEAILSQRVAGLFGLSHTWLIFVFTCISGGLLGGFSALCGKLFRDIFRKRKSYYYL